MNLGTNHGSFFFFAYGDLRRGHSQHHTITSDLWSAHTATLRGARLYDGRHSPIDTGRRALRLTGNIGDVVLGELFLLAATPATKEMLLEELSSGFNLVHEYVTYETQDETAHVVRALVCEWASAIVGNIIPSYPDLTGAAA